MKISFWHLVTAYLFAFAFFIVYSLTSTTECEAYWMHDASIVINPKRLAGYCTYLFILPTAILFLQKKFRHKTNTKLFAVHFFISLTSISLITVATNKPCEFINGGHYMFIDPFFTLGYYLFKLISFILICVIAGTTIISAKSRTNKQTEKLDNEQWQKQSR